MLLSDSVTAADISYTKARNLRGGSSSLDLAPNKHDGRTVTASTRQSKLVCATTTILSMSLQAVLTSVDA